MAGTLSATIAIGQAVNAAHAGNGALAAQIIERYAATALLNGAGALDVAAILGRFDRALALTGSGVLAPVPKQIYALPAALAGSGALAGLGTASFARAANLLSDGVLSATAAKYVPPVISVGAGAGNFFKSGASGTALNVTFNLGVAADDNLVIVGLAGRGGSTGNLPAPTITVGGVAMTLVGSRIVNTFAYSIVAIYKLKNPPAGTVSVVVTGTLSAASTNRGIAAWAQCYKNANADGIGGVGTNFGNSSASNVMTTTAVVPTGGYSFSAAARFPLSGSYTTSDGTILYNVPATTAGLLIGVFHEPGAGAVVTTTANHNSGSSAWGDVCCAIPPFT